ncbi:helix-turn-helix domain-containing protein [Pseudofrankia sp. BMG5.36]|uniref:helix-turn-helix domain-containing protein n=1 Tax=Pseudofrankia sp. BMG5.36 TaxID=1834512 RepID=UPI001F516167|nr:helix-turn-helix domain-containing protein [Pseudofrankia sp. BMG5.36]
MIEWAALRGRRMAEPGATDAYRAAQLAYDLGQTVRDLRQQRGWSQADLARAAGMTQSAIAASKPGHGSDSPGPRPPRHRPRCQPRRPAHPTPRDLTTRGVARGRKIAQDDCRLREVNLARLGH